MLDVELHHGRSHRHDRHVIVADQNGVEGVHSRRNILDGDFLAGTASQWRLSGLSRTDLPC